MSVLDLNNPEVKAAVQAMIEEATTGLVAKNQELLTKLKKAQKDSTIDPAEYQRLQEQLDATETKLQEANKLLKTATQEAEKHKKAYEAETSFVNKLMIDNGLTEAIISAGVKPEFAKAVKAMLSGQATLKVDGENRVAVIGEKKLADAVAEWAKSDEGKHYVVAQNNQGGGGSGGDKDKGKQKTMKRSEFEALDAQAKSDFSKEGGKLTD